MALKCKKGVGILIIASIVILIGVIGCVFCIGGAAGVSNFKLSLPDTTNLTYSIKGGLFGLINLSHEKEFETFETNFGYSVIQKIFGIGRIQIKIHYTFEDDQGMTYLSPYQIYDGIVIGPFVILI